MQKLIVALVLWCSFSVASADEAALKLVQSIPLPDIDGRIDHFAVDVKGRRAFLAALAKNTIEAVDLKRRPFAGIRSPSAVCNIATAVRILRRRTARWVLSKALTGYR